ncbi:MAG TPA: dolichol-phosphate mannosyltransferase, partial [Gemmataceae bacterium]|nr:dolichol-phosphate mannosyltransferase [Gemmataceae bacterium]
ILAAFEATGRVRLHWGWWLLSAFMTGLGVLTKGPVAVVLLVPPLWLHRRLSGQGCRIGLGPWLAFASAILAVCLPWYVAMCVRLPSFAGYFFWVHNVERFLTPFDHLRPVWFYGPILLGGLLPVSLLLIPFTRFLLSGNQAVSRRRCPELGWALLNGGWCVLFFSLSGSKLPTYILPAYPALALATGYYVSQSRWQHSRLLPAGVVGMAGLLFVAHTVLVPAYALYHSPLANPEQLAAACADRHLPVVCYPRNCDSVAFYLHRDDLHSYRSKSTHLLVQFLQRQPRTVVVFTHRHALKGLHEAAIPARLRLVGDQALGLPSSTRTGAIFTVLRRLLGETRDDLYYLAFVEPRP